VKRIFTPNAHFSREKKSFRHFYFLCVNGYNKYSIFVNIILNKIITNEKINLHCLYGR